MWERKELLAFLVLGACRVTMAVRVMALWEVKEQRGKKASPEKADLRGRLGTLVVQESRDPREPGATRYLLGFQESQDPRGSRDLQDARV